MLYGRATGMGGWEELGGKSKEGFMKEMGCTLGLKDGTNSQCGGKVGSLNQGHCVRKHCGGKASSYSRSVWWTTVSGEHICRWR